MNIYIGNFSYDVTDSDILTAFEPFGHVENIKIIKDKFTGQSRGFGFVEMPDAKEAQAAMQGIKAILGKQVTINEARPRTEYSSEGRRGPGGYGNNQRSQRF